MVDRLVNSEANSRRIAIVESCFGSSGQPLAVPGRVLVGEGVLTKMCRKKPKPRQFFLCNDILIYGNIVINKKKYNCQHIIPLEEVKLESLEDEGQFRNGWLVRTLTKSFAVYAATAAEKAEWMAHINKCVDDLLKKSGKLGATDHAAVWVPDTEASGCMHCKKSQFTLINRRHHCRKCGKVVCGPCSNKKWVLPSQSSKPLRVCLSCYDELSRAKTDDSRLGDNRDIRPAHQSSVDSSSDESDDDVSNGNAAAQEEPNITQFYRKSAADSGDAPAPTAPPAADAATEGHY
ncbi:pleckstrin homology domain-containing family F member 2-like [Pollicipes pollicipes]|uniref:pleckstrin homology domain-containing family F member 2-like n=1 Tax=Pollicipes pollicipes TaxID=41117 RepID=UPI0018855CE2|nr:pleckstrin homology domain-containing family F member 2-like [Pollicipes pollicipes]